MSYVITRRHAAPSGLALAVVLALAITAAFAALAAPYSAALHKVQVSDPDAAQRVVEQGGRLVADYGSYQLYEVAQPQTALAGHAAIENRDAYNTIHLHAAVIDTSKPEGQALRATAGAFTGKRLHLVQFAGPVKPAWHDELRRTGARVVCYVPNNAYLVYGDAASVGNVQGWAATAPHVQWDAPFLDGYKVHPLARVAFEAGTTAAIGTDEFAVQLVDDAAANAATLGLIDRLKLAPISRQHRILNYLNVVVRLAPASVPLIAAQPEVVSIQPYFRRAKFCERQDQIVAGNLSGSVPSGPGYLAWLAGRGFTQAQFDASGFAVDLSDSGVDNGTTAPNHFGLHVGGNAGNASRVIYNRLEGTPNAGSTIQGCDGHGNLNSHIISGYDDLAGFPFADASGFHYGLGVCPFIRIGSSVIFDPGAFTYPDYNDLQARAYNNGARLSSNSWGAPTAGAYDVDAQTYDALVRDAQPAGTVYATAGNQEMVIVFAAGNDGPGALSVGAPGTAKNVITVGAAENVQAFGGADGSGIDDNQADSANDIVGFSSRGPCDDGRVKPDIVAPGTHVSGGVAQAANPGPSGTPLACYDGSGVSGGVKPSHYFPPGQYFYTASSGTSHSTPCVAGACGLLRQFFLNQGKNAPSPAMTKAYLVNAARYLTGANANDTLPSNNQGMGELNLGAAFDGVARIMRDEVDVDRFTASGQTRTFTGVINDTGKPFRVTLAWTDAPGSTTGNAFNNDLDLTVTIGGQTYFGNVFSGSRSVVGGNHDPANNLESVFLPAGVSGPFSVNVTAANINSDGVPGNANPLDQDFALVVYNGTPTGAPIVAFDSATLLAESYTPTNGVIDAGETVTVNLALKNVGIVNASDVVATLATGGGVTRCSGSQDYGLLRAGGSAVSRPFMFTAGGACGSTLTATLQIQNVTNSLGAVANDFAIGKMGTAYLQTFDGGTALPAGWTTWKGGAQNNAWTISATKNVTAPYSAFSGVGPSNVGSNALVSPVLPIVSPSAQLTFQNFYYFQSTYDGGVFEIKIGNGAFTDILAAGGSFVNGGYNKTLNATRGNPLGGRRAWSGTTLAAFFTTAVNLPAGAAGQNVQFRWLCGYDNRTASNGGWYIDNVNIQDVVCESCANADLAVAQAAAPNPVLTSQALTYTLTVTNTGPSTATSVAVVDALPSSLALLSAIASQGACSNVAGVLNCALGSLPPAGVATVVVDVVPIATASITTVTNTATVHAQEIDPWPGNNSVSTAATVYLDSVGDGIPNWWRLRYFGGTGDKTNLRSCAACDPDSDGEVNVAEYLSGTDPTNALSVLRVSSVLALPGAFTVSWLSVPGKTYKVVYTDALGGAWLTDLPASQVSAGPGMTSLNYTDATSGSVTQRFYRVDLVLP